ncbi:MAG: hypothetical protein NT010_09090 [Proteobacteria bacterium]|nr:hypothetical protein [Pseudomonadota bacterium]
MKKTVIVLIMIISIFGFGRICEAQQSEKTTVKGEISFQVGKSKHTYSGCFKDKCSVNVGQNIMLHTIEKTLGGEPKSEKNFLRLMFWYRLTGRTGEKTFNIESGMDSISIYDGSPNLSSDKKAKLQNMYFSAGDTVPLARSLYFGCSEAKDQMIKLKMIELKGNSLMHQIILPDCMKEIATD